MTSVQAEIHSTHVKEHFELKETCVLFDETGLLYLVINMTGWHP